MRYSEKQCDEMIATIKDAVVASLDLDVDDTLGPYLVMTFKKGFECSLRPVVAPSAEEFAAIAPRVVGNVVKSLARTDVGGEHWVMTFADDFAIKFRFMAELVN